MTITVVEFSTALPYLGAVAILTNAGLTAAQWLPILAAYNLVFVAPPLLLLGAYRAFGARLRPAFERWGERLRGAGRETLLWILGIAGFLLLADSLRYFEFFGLV
jgi:cytochrome c biogenesis protein CcdA